MKTDGTNSSAWILAAVLMLPVMLFAASPASAQKIVDKTVATVSDRAGNPELITYSDLLWQLALEPGVPLTPPTADDLARALQTQIKQRLFALEAKRLPQEPPTEAEVNAEIQNILRYIPTAEFESRLRSVGFKSVRDPNFIEMMENRVKINKYVDFRFRSFVVVTPDEEVRYYRETFVPEFRNRYPGLLMPTLDEKRAEIRRILIETRVAANIQTFLDEAERNAEVVTLIEP